MDYPAKWRELTRTNKLLSLLDTFLKGYGQVLICLNPLSGLSLAIALIYLSTKIFLLTLLGTLSSTLTAFLIRARTQHIRAGVYGFNGVVLGIAWLWFLKLDAFSVILLVIAGALSTLIMKLFIDMNSRTRVNLPVFSLPSVLLLWLVFILLPLLHKGSLGPDQYILNYLNTYRAYVITLNSRFLSILFWETFYRQITIAFILLLGITLHSRISALFYLLALILTLIMTYALRGRAEFLNIDFYLYNTIPTSIALGGTFLVLNRKTFFFTLSALIAVMLTVFIGIRVFPLPVFVAPFNFLVILFIWLVKANILKRHQGFSPVPMELILSPEFALGWFKGEEYAAKYWRSIEDGPRNK